MAYSERIGHRPSHLSRGIVPTLTLQRPPRVARRFPPMKHAQAIQLAILSISLVAFGAIGARAQEVVLPKPEPPFQGKIGRTVKDSTPDFPKSVEAPAGAPNVLLIMTDDVGFGASSTFGGPIQTPNFQRIA